MRRSCLSNLARALMFILVVWATNGRAALPDIGSCIDRLDPQHDIGYDRIAARCPELMKQLEHGAWVPWLPRGWKESNNDLSAGGLRELRDLVNRESAASASHPAPQVGRVNVVLSGLANKGSGGWWSRFKGWLRSILERRDQTTDESWFAKMASQVGVPQSLRQIVAYVALAAVVLLAGVIILNEMRAAGLLPIRRFLERRARSTRAVATSGPGPVNFEGAPARDKPGLLLELILRKLNERGLLPPAAALTVREMIRIVRLAETDDRSRLSELALAAERVRYSGGEPQVAALDGTISRGRELLQRLEAGAS